MCVKGPAAVVLHLQRLAGGGGPDGAVGEAEQEGAGAGGGARQPVPGIKHTSQHPDKIT